jgi:hypothetical protein
VADPDDDGGVGLAGDLLERGLPVRHEEARSIRFGMKLSCDGRLVGLTGISD